MSSTAKSCINQHAEHLKNQGNQLHQKGQYKAAYSKYTEAIKEDPQNAIYYANRAASSLAMRQYMDAAADAKKATKIDPKYGKAWARLGAASQALSSWTESRDAWKRALESLPSDDKLLTEMDKKLKSQYTEGLHKAEETLKNPPKPVGFEARMENMPWTKAEALEQELIKAQKISSGFVILEAYREFKKGVDTMKALEQRKGPTGQMQWWGKPEALVEISNGIMRDPRVFHIDSNDWIDKYNKQVIFESEVFKAWKEGGANVVKEQSLQRLKREGWQAVRPALATTVRAWIMCGFLAINTKREVVSMEYYSRVIDILEWGHRTWANVRKEDRGVIFEPTFIRAAKRLRLNALHEIIASKAKNCHYTREELAEWCRELVAETEANPPAPGTQIDPSSLAAFWMYPKGDALAILGWHHMQLGLAADNAESAFADFTTSANYYIKAAHAFPEDEENRPYYLGVAIEAYWYQNKPLKHVLFLIAGIAHSYPEIMRLWEHSASASQRDPGLMQAFNFASRCKEAMERGYISEEDVVKPEAVRENDPWATPTVKYV